MEGKIEEFRCWSPNCLELSGKTNLNRVLTDCSQIIADDAIHIYAISSVLKLSTTEMPIPCRDISTDNVGSSIS